MRGVLFLCWQPLHRWGLAVDARDGGRWQKSALCVQTDPEVFFPDQDASARAANRVCSRCEVKSECLEDALGRGERFRIAQ